MTTTTITGSQGAYTFAGAGNTLVNQGTITGPVGVRADFLDNMVVNSGTITSNTSSGLGILVTSRGTVTNQSSGLISGFYGIGMAGTAGVVVNAGTITGGTSTASRGIFLAEGGSITNLAGGTISGGIGVVSNRAVTLVNAGFIGGSSQTAVSLAAGFNHRVTLLAGGSFGGTVNGGNTIGASRTSTLALGAGTAFGQLTLGLGTYILNFGQIAIESGASWALTGKHSIANGVTLTNNGTAFFANGTLTNAGLIQGGLSPGGGGTLVNAATGTVSGTIAIHGNFAAPVVVNSGLISGGTSVDGAGVRLFQGGTITNQSGGLITGHAGINGWSPVTIVNAGRISGDTVAGRGVELLVGGVITNQSGGTISGATGMTASGATVVNASGGTITGATGLHTKGSASGITNAGLITGTVGPGIVLTANDTVTNQSSGLITGYFGVRGEASATVTNAGTITGNGVNGSGIVLFVGGAVTNQSGGTVSGRTGVRGAGVAVVNAGRIEGTAGFGISISGGGTVTNQSGGTITGYDGLTIQDATATVVNSGRIIGQGTANGRGAMLAAGGTLSNASTGLISAAVAIDILNAGVTIENAGTVLAIMAGVNPGITMREGGVVTNHSSGRIQGVRGIAIAGGAGTVSNSGTIQGTSAAAISLAAGFANSVTLSPIGTVTGTIDGGNTIGASAVSTLVLASAVSAGTLSGLGGSVVNFGRIAINTNANWVLGGTNTLANGVSLTNSGTLSATGTLFNEIALPFGLTFSGAGYAHNRATGTIQATTALRANVAGLRVRNSGVLAGGTTSGGRGVALTPGGTLVNDAAGVISGQNAVYGNALQTTITNSGSLVGTGASSVGVFLNAGGVLTNQATGLITGNTGVSVRGAAGTVSNAGTIVGSGGTAVSMIAGFAHTLLVAGGASFSGLIDGGNTIGGTIASSLVLVSGTSAGTLTSFQNTFLNFGTVSIASGAGWTLAGDTTLAAGARLIAGSGAVETGTFTNAGSVSGGLTMPSGGIVRNLAGATIDGTVGVSIAGGAGTITNAGSITGSGGTAVAMAAGFNNAVSLAVGGGFTGVVHAGNTAGGSASSVLTLLSGTSTGTISGLGSQFLGFTGIDVVDGAAWTASGTNTVTTGVNLNVAATSTLTAGAALTVRGSVTNAGQIREGLTAGSNGQMTNLAGGTISGTRAVAGSGLGLSVANMGLIEGGAGTAGYGVWLLALFSSLGSVTNSASGTIQGNVAVMAKNSPLSLVNAGVITGGSSLGAGVSFSRIGTITNQAGGTITGAIGIGSDNTGVSGGGSRTTITNAGTILGTGTAGHGVTLAFAGTVDNRAGGRIEGQTGVTMTGKYGTVTNAGTIVGQGGIAVSLAAGSSNLVQVDSGAVFTGIVDGGNTAGYPTISTLELRSSASTGTISGVGTDFINFSDVRIASGASWVMTGSNTIVAGQSLVNAGSLTLDSATLGTTMLLGTGALTIGDASVLTVNGTVAAGATIGMDGKAAAFHLSAPIGMAGTVTSFGLGDTITLAGIDPLSVTYSGGFLQFGGGSSFALTVLDSLVVEAVSDGAGGALVSAACFVTGTLIETTDGPVPIEALRPGDTVLTHGGGSRPIRWIGYRHLDLTRHAFPAAARPIVIAAGALADGVPTRTLRVSPEHGMYLANRLIPARLLINEATITQDQACAAVTYFHLELDSHDLILSEGAASESYLDTGNRAVFENGPGAVTLHPLFAETGGQDRRVAESCVPFADDPRAVEPVWRMLADRAIRLGRPLPAPVTTGDPAPRLLIADRMIAPIAAGQGVYTFVLPRGSCGVRLRSRATAPSDLTPWHNDSRRLGLAVRRIRLREGDLVTDLPLDHPALTDGWWGIESDDQSLWRWSNGDAMLRLADGGVRVLEITARPLPAYRLEAEAETVSRAAA